MFPSTGVADLDIGDIDVCAHYYVFVIGRASLVFILRGVTRFTPLLSRLVQ